MPYYGVAGCRDVDHCDLPRLSIKGMTPEQVHSQVFGRGMPMVLVRHNRL